VLSKVRSRGILDDDPAAKPVVPQVETTAPDAAPIEIPASLWSEWPFNPINGWLIRPGHETRRIAVGFVDVRFYRADIQALAKDAPAEQAQPASKKRRPSLKDRLADELRASFPDGRPAMKVDEISRCLSSRPTVGSSFARRTLEAAIQLAWPQPN
jgi:hypothetical protein